MFGAYRMCVIDMHVLKSLQNFKNLKGTSVLLLAAFTSYCSSKADFMSGRACNDFWQHQGGISCSAAVSCRYISAAWEEPWWTTWTLVPSILSVVSLWIQSVWWLLDLGFTLSWNLRNWEIDEAEKNMRTCIVSCWLLFPKDVTYLSARREDWGGTDGKQRKLTMLQAIPPATCEHRRKES